MNESLGKDFKAPKAKPTSLDEIWGFKVSKYKTDSEEEYKRSLKKMNVADLHTECLRLRESPKQDRARMEDMLIKLFRKYTNSTKNSDIQAVVPKSEDRNYAARRALADMLGTAMVD